MPLPLNLNVMLSDQPSMPRRWVLLAVCCSQGGLYFVKLFEGPIGCTAASGRGDCSLLRHHSATQHSCIIGSPSWRFGQSVSAGSLKSVIWRTGGMDGSMDLIRGSRVQEDWRCVLPAGPDQEIEIGGRGAHCDERVRL